MNLERIGSGVYSIRDGEREARIVKGLNRKWKVEPAANLPGERVKSAISYAEAKMFAENMLTRGGARDFVTVKQPGGRGADAEVEAVRRAIADRLKRIADEILSH